MNLFINDSMKSDLKLVFPELTSTQIEIISMFSSGVTIQDIAMSRGVSVTAIKHSIDKSKGRC